MFGTGASEVEHDDWHRSFSISFLKICNITADEWKVVCRSPDFPFRQKLEKYDFNVFIALLWFAFLLSVSQGSVIYVGVCQRLGTSHGRDLNIRVQKWQLLLRSLIDFQKCQYHCRTNTHFDCDCERFSSKSRKSCGDFLIPNLVNKWKIRTSTFSWCCCGLVQF